MIINDSIVRVKDFFLDLTQVLSRRLLRRTILTLFVGALLTVTNIAYAAPVLVRWPGCPVQWGQYNFPLASDFSNGIADPYPAHAEPFPVAAPSGGDCSLDVVSGTLMSKATSAGGFVFDTPGEMDGATYTIAFDMQWVSGKNPWQFTSETAGNGVIGGLTFSVPYPGDNCWHRYEYTKAIGSGSAYGSGPRTEMFVYQVGPGQQEMRIANLTLTQVNAAAHQGLVVGKAEGGGGCCEPKAKSQ